MFIATTLIACWLGWELNLFRERRGLRESLGEQAGYQFVTLDSFGKSWAPPELPRPAPSWLRRLLGDEPVYTIWYPPDMPETAPEVARLRRVFPEAELRQVQYEPCHPGCFPAATPIETPGGPRRVDSLRPGELVLTVDPSGKTSSAPIVSVFVANNRLLRLELESGLLLTTAKQPLCRPNGQVLPAGQIAPGDEVLRWQGGALRVERVLRIDSAQGTALVFNLVLGNSQVFVAGGVLAQSKPPATGSDPQA